MGGLIVLAVLILLAIVPIGISAVYNSGGPLVWIIAGPIRFTLYPRKKAKKKHNKAEATKTTDPDDFETKKTKNSGKGGNFTEFLPLIQILFDLFRNLGKKLRVDRLDMKLTLGGDDPCDLSINYGRAWAALGSLVPQLERLFVIKKHNLKIECDFTSDQTLLDARLDMTITVGRLFSILVRHGIRALHEYFKINNKRKGGAIT